MNIGNSLIKAYKTLPKNVIISNLGSRGYAFKSDLKIKWVRPEKIPCFKPEKSGDLELFPKIDQNQLQAKYRDCKELKDADPMVQKLLSLEFAPYSHTISTYVDNMADRVERHDNDLGSIESRIARWTGGIRALQDLMEKYPRNRRMKVQLKELIDKRKKHLKYLRKWDYKKFEWLLENLNIVYKPPPPQYHRVTRKESLRKLTNKYCDEVIAKKLDEYKHALREEQPGFLEEKIRSLEFIRDEEKACGVEISVSQDEIDDAKKRLEILRKDNQVQANED